MEALVTRSTLRRTLRDRRNALSSLQQQQAAQAVLDNLFSLPVVATATSIACYLPNDGEVDLRPFVKACWRQNEHAPKQTSLPVLHPVCKGHLLFLRYSRSTPMTLNKYRIEEPALACPNVIPTLHHQVILMPLVGFDEYGNRLGMGGGYYDRTLAGMQAKAVRPRLVGIAHDCQQVKQLPIQSWDVPVDTIITPTQQLNFMHQ